MRSLFFGLALLFQLGTTGQSPVLMSTKDAVEDIEQLVDAFERIHYNPYFKNSKQEVYHLRDEFLAKWKGDSITVREFTVAGMSLSAMMSGGHSNMYWQNPKLRSELEQYLFIPFTGKLVDNSRNFVITKSGHNSLQPGTRVKSINGISVAELFKDCMNYTGGVEAYKMANVERVFPVYLYFNSKVAHPYKFEFDNEEATLSLEGIDVYELAAVLNEEQEYEDYTFEILEQEVGLISYNSCNDFKRFKKFLKGSFEAMASENINKLIIDVRRNGGGDSRLNDELLSYITSKPYRQSSGRYWKVSKEAKEQYAANKVYRKMFGKPFMERYMNTPNQEIIVDMDTTGLTYPEKPQYFFEGQSCILIGPSTFSSANFLADAVKTFKITTLIGAPTGEYNNDFGEQLSINLKNSGSLVFISSTYDIGANGNDAVFEPVYPDLKVEGDALEFAVNWLAKKGNVE